MSSCNVDLSANKLNKQEIRRAAQNLIREGKSKQESLAILKKKYHHTKFIVKVLSCLPTLNQKKKYQFINYILFISLLISLALFATNLAFGASIIYALLSVVVIKIIPKFYIWISAISLISLSSISVIYFSEPQGSVFLFLTVALSNITSLILSFYLEQKLCPKAEETKEKYLDNSGTTRIRIIYTFTE